MKTKKLTRLIFSIGLSLGFVMPALADTPAPQPNPAAGIISALNTVNSSVAGLGTRIDSFVSANAQKEANLLYQANQTVANTENLNINLITAYDNAKKLSSQNTLGALKIALAELPARASEGQANGISLSQNKAVADLANEVGSDTLLPPNGGNYTPNLNNNPGNAVLPNDVNMNFDSLFSPIAYTANESTTAQTFLNYFAEQYKATYPDLDFSGLKGNTKALQTLMQNSDYQLYVVQKRSSLAQESIALSNLNHLIAERTVQKGLGANTGMPMQDASLLQLENYTANHRIDSNNWYQSMNSASPATVQRETLFVLAEIESQLQRLHMDNEIMIATLSAMQMQNAQINNTMSQQQANTVQKYINSTLEGKKQTQTSSAQLKQAG